MSDERNTVLAELGEAEVTAHELARAFVQPVVAVLASGGEHWIRLAGQLQSAGDDAQRRQPLVRHCVFLGRIGNASMLDRVCGGLRPFYPLLGDLRLELDPVG
ncbi:MAG TPA: hypothetical protein VF070_09545 [Streptosporangiaceae bacterium]